LFTDNNRFGVYWYCSSLVSWREPRKPPGAETVKPRLSSANDYPGELHSRCPGVSICTALVCRSRVLIYVITLSAAPHHLSSPVYWALSYDAARPPPSNTQQRGRALTFPRAAPNSYQRPPLLVAWKLELAIGCVVSLSR
jgi:hypothetical protein